jgi:membrane protein
MRALQSTFRAYLSGLRRELADKAIGLWAQAIAFKVLVTTVPLVVLATGVAGWGLHREDASAAVAAFTQRFVPGDQVQAVLAFLDAVQASSPTILSVGGAGLVLSVVFLFSTLRETIGNALARPGRASRSPLRGYLFDLRMTLQVGLFFLLTIGLSVGMQSVLHPSLAGRLGGILLSLVITIVMFAQLYYFVPLPHPSATCSLRGGLVAGGLWELAKQLFTWMAAASDPLDVDSPAEGVSALTTLFGIVVAFVTWVYYSGLVLLLGALVASVCDRSLTSTEAP